MLFFLVLPGSPSPICITHCGLCENGIIFSCRSFTIYEDYEDNATAFDDYEISLANSSCKLEASKLVECGVSCSPTECKHNGCAALRSEDAYFSNDGSIIIYETY